MATISLKQTKSVIYKAYQEAIAEAKRLQSEVSTVNQALSKSKSAYNNAMQQLNTAKKSSKPGVQQSTPKSTAKVNSGSLNNLNGVISTLR